VVYLLIGSFANAIVTVRFQDRYDSDPIEDFDDALNQEFGPSSPSAAASQRKRKRSAVDPADVTRDPGRDRDRDRDRNRDRDRDRDAGRNTRVSRWFLADYTILILYKGASHC
jgi:hypothetical protein